jgi:hypothetical protein
MTQQPQQLRQTNHRGGRPAKPKGVRKEYPLSTKLNEIEHDFVLNKCHEAGLSKSEFLRQALLNAQVGGRLSQEVLGLMRQISGLANNVNQLAHKANAEGFYLVSQAAIEVVNALKELLHKINAYGR